MPKLAGACFMLLLMYASVPRVSAAQQIHSAFICWASRSYVYSEVIEAIPACGTRSILAKLTVNRGAA